ncbi:MAG: GFA family protein [Gammaproteobacteria bacterium]|nr:GFA family protein [Gammaproteobacteria bacterium]
MKDGHTQGRCLCGEVRYEATGPTGEMWYCHCPGCRKASGVGFGTWIEAADLRWLSGRDCVTQFAASPGITRAFCSQCGTVLPARRAAGGVLLPAGGLENVGGQRPCGHASAEARLPWLPPLDADLPVRRVSCADETSSGASQEAVAEGLARGGCLCGAIAYEVKQPLAAMRVCHCSRCRRRSGSSWFVGLTCAPGTLRFLRGEAGIVRWHMPGTRFYVVSFCGTCGSAAPAVLPRATFFSAGCLDNDPGARALCHIYYGSRAPWVEVRDSLPRFGEFAPPDFNWQASRP